MGRTRALRNVKEVELEDIPKLTKCSLVTSFKCVESVKMESVSKLGDVKALKQEWEKRKEEEERLKKEREEEERRREEAEEEKRKEEERKRRERERKKQEEEERRKEEEKRRRKEAEEAAKKTAVISCKRDWDCINRHVSVIEVSDKCCNAEGLRELDLSVFVNLRELKVGKECFEYVKKVNICGLRELERMIVGSKSFTKEKDEWFSKKDGRFYLKDCPKLKSLKMGRYSFSDYTVCEIENCGLEVIEIGDLNVYSPNFYWASLELKSILIHSE